MGMKSRFLILLMSLGAGLATTLVAAEPRPWEAAIFRGDYDAAQVAIEQALAERPTDTTLRYQLARVLTWSGQHDAALGTYDELLTQEPVNADYYLGRPLVLTRLGRDDEALHVTQAALALAPDYEDVWRLHYGLVGRLEGADAQALVRSQVAARYPTASWWHAPPTFPHFTRFVSLGWGLERLSTDAPDWDLSFVRFDWERSKTMNVFGELVRSTRFDATDLGLAVGGSWRGLEDWNLTAAASLVPNSNFEPQQELSFGAGHSWSGGWGTEFALRQRRYASDTVSTYSVTGEKYFSDYRIAYGANFSRLHHKASSVGHIMSLGWHPGGGRSIALVVAGGDEAEAIGIGQVLKTDVQSITLTGRNRLSDRVVLSWWVGTHRQGNFYRRRYAGLAARFGL